MYPNADVQGSLSRARFAAVKLEVDTARLEAALPALHSLEAHDAITAELVACTLGARRRLELRTDVPGRLTHALQKLGRALRAAGLAVAR